jgi:DNA-binding NarL/FixJ family response regulator
MDKKDLVSRIWVSVIEDNHFIRTGWVSVLGQSEEVKVIGNYPSCEDAFRDPAFTSSDVVLMDIALGTGMTGIEGAAVIKEHHPAIAVVMCTVYEDEQKIFDALCAGAVGYLLKEVESDELIKAIRAAKTGGSPMTPKIARKVISTFHKPSDNSTDHQASLTEREREVLELLARGKTYAAIAGELFLSIDGVSSRIRKIYEKLQANSRAEAVAKGLAKRIINPFKIEK